MPAYIIAYGEITNSEVFIEYELQASPLLRKFGGKVVAGGNTKCCKATGTRKP